MKKKFPERNDSGPSENDTQLNTIRLQKFLSEAGLCSRRGAAEIVDARRVTVDGELADSLGMRIDPKRSKVLVDGRPVQSVRARSFTYLALNKPRGFITTLDDPGGRKTVLDLLKGVRDRVVPVGRLDRDSEGLLLFTNDGDLIYRLTHPKYEIEKEYQVTVNGLPREDDLQDMREGIDIEGQVTLPARVWIREVREGAGEGGAPVTVMGVVLKEGRKRQVRRMCEAVGLDVRRLMRVREGKIELGDMKPGSYRVLKQNEVKALKKETGLIE